jgi:hypothetical protein
MLTIIPLHQRTELFLTVQMLEALQAIEYDLPSFDTEPRSSPQIFDFCRMRARGGECFAALPSALLWGRLRLGPR